MEEQQYKQQIEQIKRIHARVVLLWKQKQKYMESMKKSQKHIEQIQKKEKNVDREKLVTKLKSHIERVLGQYMPVMNQIAALGSRSLLCMQTLGLTLEKEESPSQEIIKAVQLAQQTNMIMIEASSF